MIAPQKKTLKSMLCTVLLCTVAIAPDAALADLQQTVKFKIAPQLLQEALIKYSAQSGVQVTSPSGIITGKNSAGVSGTLSAREALAQLLQGTNLTYDVINANTVTIRPVTDTAATPKAGQRSELTNQSLAMTLTVAELSRQVDASADMMADAADKKKSSVNGDDVEEMIVEEQRIKPFSDRNTDRPRTINDEQPYYIFDAKTIERSAARNVEDFLKSRLTMNSAVQLNTQTPTSSMGNASSSINLRGLGTDKTLILVNGRRLVSIVIQGGDDRQTDINAIPLSSIDRIEVLPSSASGIYGGGAVGGVVNVVLKKDYSGGEVRLSYDNAWDTDAASRAASATFGQAFESGKTNLMLTASWSDTDALRLADRRGLLDAGIGRILQNDPSRIYSVTSPFQGAAPNISPSSSTVTSLVLRDGRSLNSRNTMVPFGTAPGTSLAALSDALLQNAGQWNFDLPETMQSPTGLLRPLRSAPTTKSFMAILRRQMTSRIEAFAEYTYQGNAAEGISSPISSFTVPVWTPTTPSANPFTTPVVVRFPATDAFVFPTNFVTRALTLGANIKLPRDWAAQFDYTRSKNRNFYSAYLTDYTAMNVDVNNGIINPFVDTMRYPIDFSRYTTYSESFGVSTLDAFSLRGSGPLLGLPWGTPTLTTGLERRVSVVPGGTAFENIYAISSAENVRINLFGREQSTDSIYGELQIPLVAKAALPLLHSLDFQISGRSERYVVDAGTTQFLEYPNNPSRNSYSGNTLNGRPFKAKASYVSNNITYGLKYQPVESITVRTSTATAFIPPTPGQLIPNPTIATQQQVTDPRTGILTTDVSISSGGNPNLKPQNSKGWNAGLIWEPQWMRERGLRFNAEYYRIRQFDQITSIGAQAIVNEEASYPGRVTRNANGRIVFVDNSMVNLYKLETEGWDFSLDQRVTTRLGDISLRTAHTYIMHEQRQLSLTIPILDYAGYVAEGGPAKLKGNASLTWENRDWVASWTTYYYGSYKQSGARGGPASIRLAGGGISGTTVAAQGSETIPAQLYHDLFVGYTFAKPNGGVSTSTMWGAGIMSGTTLQFGIKNVFNTAPPFDANYSGTFYISPYGDLRLRSYWINLTKSFD